MPFELFVATRYLLARRGQPMMSLVSVISILGVAAGVMALIIALALNSGFQNEFKEKILSATAHVTLLQSQGSSIKNYGQLSVQLVNIENVESVAPTIYGQVLLQSDLGRKKGIYLRGVDPSRADFLGDLLEQIVEGDAASFGVNANLPEIIVGQDLAESLGLLVGDRVRAVGLKGELAPFPIGRSVRYRTFHVVGIFKSGLWEYDAHWALVPLSEAQRFEGMKSDQVSVLEFRLNDVDRAQETANRIKQLLGAGFITRTWMELNRPLFSALQLEKLALFMAIGLIVLVAALNIIITLMMMVMEKVKDIAVINAMGGLPSTISRIFMLKGLIIGATGTVIGSTVGSLLVWYLNTQQIIALDKQVYAISYVPFDLRITDVALVSFLALVVSFLATIYPAVSASRLNPVEGLRYE